MLFFSVALKSLRFRDNFEPQANYMWAHSLPPGWSEAVELSRGKHLTLSR